MTWLVVLLVLAALAVVGWLAFRRNGDPDEAERRRTAEERLRAREERAERRRRLGLPDDDEKRHR